MDCDDDLVIGFGSVLSFSMFDFNFGADITGTNSGNRSIRDSNSPSLHRRSSTESKGLGGGGVGFFVSRETVWFGSISGALGGFELTGLLNDGSGFNGNVGGGAETAINGLTGRRFARLENGMDRWDISNPSGFRFQALDPGCRSLRRKPEPISLAACHLWI